MSPCDQFKASGVVQGVVARLCVGALLAVAGPAAAQEDLFALPLVAPCTQAESPADVAPALIAAGWSQVALDSDRGRDIIRAAGQGVEGYVSLPAAFTDVSEVEDFVARASDAWLGFARWFPASFATFERDGIVLLIRHNQPPESDLECFFAASEFPLAEQLLAETVDVERGALRLRQSRTERFGNKGQAIFVIGLSAPEAALPLLTGRYSILVQHDYRADQLPD